MSTTAYNYVWGLQLRGAELTVMLCLADHHNGKTGQCNPSYERIADRCGLSRRHAIRVVNNLINSGLLSARYSAGYNSNQYDFVPPNSDTAVSPDNAPNSDTAVSPDNAPNSDIAVSPDNAPNSDIAVSPQTVTFEPQTVTFEPQNSDIAVSPKPGNRINRMNRKGEPEKTPSPSGRNLAFEKSTKKPASIHVLQRITNKQPPRGIWGIVDEAVGHDQADVARWEQVVRQWVLTGYNPQNIGGMLEYFNRQELPGRNGNVRSGSGKSGINGKTRPAQTNNSAAPVRYASGISLE